MVLKKIDNHIKKVNLNSYLIPYTQIKWKWIIDQKIRAEIMKLLETTQRKFGGLYYTKTSQIRYRKHKF